MFPEIKEVVNEVVQKVDPHLLYDLIWLFYPPIHLEKVSARIVSQELEVLIKAT